MLCTASYFPPFYQDVLRPAISYVCIFVEMGVTYTVAEHGDQPAGKVANPARGQLNREIIIVWVSPSRTASACSFSTPRLNVALAHGILPAFRDGVHLFIPSTAIGSVPSLSGHAFAYR